MTEDKRIQTAPAAVKADVWAYFGFKVKEGSYELDKSHAVCKLCNARVKYSGNTTNFASTCGETPWQGSNTSRTSLSRSCTEVSQSDGAGLAQLSRGSRFDMRRLDFEGHWIICNSYSTSHRWPVEPQVTCTANPSHAWQSYGGTHSSVTEWGSDWMGIGWKRPHHCYR